MSIPWNYEEGDHDFSILMGRALREGKERQSAQSYLPNQFPGCKFYTSKMRGNSRRRATIRGARKIPANRIPHFFDL